METEPKPRGFCKGCSYSLQGLTAIDGGHRCPECGRQFDPVDAKSFRADLHSRAVHWITKPVGAWTVLVSAVAALGMIASSGWWSYTIQPSAVDLWYYLAPATLSDRSKLVTVRDYIFTYCMPAAIAAFAGGHFGAIAAVIDKFREMIITGGLTAPEAEGLIASWQTQFFQADDTRLLMLMFRESYDSFCQIEIRPARTEMVLVGIILTELH